MLLLICWLWKHWSRQSSPFLFSKFWVPTWGNVVWPSHQSSSGLLFCVIWQSTSARQKPAKMWSFNHTSRSRGWKDLGPGLDLAGARSRSDRSIFILKREVQVC
jgi:hypothetical protein